MSVTRCILVRHGQTAANVDGRLDTGLPGLPLTDLGREQAKALVPVLSSERVASIAVSSLQRTHLTAAPLAHHHQLPPSQFDGLAEIRAGDLELRSDDEARSTYLDTAFGWAAGDLLRQMPGGSNGATFFARFDDAMRQLTVDRETVVAFSHGAAIRVWLARRAENVDVEFAARHALGNTGRVTIERDHAQRWSVTAWESNPAGHGTSPQSLSQDPTGAGVTDVPDGST